MSEFGTSKTVKSKVTARVVRYENISLKKTFMQSYQNKWTYVKRNPYTRN